MLCFDLRYNLPLAISLAMAIYWSSSRPPYGENGNTLSINTERARLHDVLAVRGSPSPERQFDPQAPVFVNNQDPTHNHSAAPDINMLPQEHNLAEHIQNTGQNYAATSEMHKLPQEYSPAENNQNAVDHRHIRPTQDQNVVNYEQNPMPHGENLTLRSGPMRLPRPGHVPGPTESPPVLARPRSAAVQYSPPHRAYHEPMTISHENESVSAVNQSSRAFRLLRQLERLESRKKLNLTSFKNAYEQSVDLRKKIGSLRFGSNDQLQELYKSEVDLLDADRAKEKYGNIVKRLEVEIEELYGDLTVLGEAMDDDEWQADVGE